ncbi:hypothetical protein [Bradyrhizobium sp. USDA 4353]
MPVALHSIAPLRKICRFAGVLAYAGAMLVYRHAQPIAGKAYDDFCASQGMAFGQPTPVSDLCVILLVAALPMVLVRGTVAVS